MDLSRRSFLILTDTAAGGVYTGLSSAEASPAGDVVGKITVGYRAGSPAAGTAPRSTVGGTGTR